MWETFPEWSLAWLWQWTGSFEKAILLLLFVMLLHACAVFGERIWNFRKVHGQLRSLLRTVDRTDAKSTLASAVAAATANLPHPLARIVMAGFAAFHISPSLYSNQDALDMAQRATQRSAALIRTEMKAGFTTIATIAALSPFVGLAGTVIGVLYAFRGLSGSRDQIRAWIANDIALALLPTAVALMVGVLAYAFYNHLVRRSQVFDLDLLTVSDQVLNYLHAHAAERATMTPFATDEPRPSEARHDRFRVLFLSVGGVWLYVVFVLAYAIYWSLAHPYY